VIGMATQPDEPADEDPAPQKKAPAKVAKEAAKNAEPAKVEAPTEAQAPTKVEQARPRVRLRVQRQDAFDQPKTQRWEEFDVAVGPGATVHSCLEAIRRSPQTTSGQSVSPVAWEASCLEETCGSCTMLVNGRARQACSTLVREVSPRGQLIVLEPLRKFPLERDLIVDRTRMFAALGRVKAWVMLDGTSSPQPAPAQSPALQRERYDLSSCISCGICLEACPQFHEGNAFVGAAAINQVRLLNRHPIGALQKTDRLESLMGDGGITDCGKAQVCVEVCPKEIPLVDSIAEMARDTTKHFLFGWLLK
jgi:succinate dehydrogenase / fumarate reductase iron-sulfur subunit